MNSIPLSLRAYRAGYAAVLALVGAGAFVFLVVVLHWFPPAWGRPALGLQDLAVLLFSKGKAVLSVPYHLDD